MKGDEEVFVNADLKLVTFVILVFVSVIFMTRVIGQTEQARNEPRIEYQVVLPNAMRQKLYQHDADFEVWNQNDYLPSIANSYRYSPRQTPSAVIGDFNGDGIKDAILDGHNKQNSLRIAILSDGTDFNVMEMQKGRLGNPKESSYGMGRGRKEYGFWVFLTLVDGPTEISSPVEQHTLDLENDAFEVSYLEKASRLFYFIDGAWRSYATGD